MGTPQRPARYRTDKKGKPMKRLRIATTALTLLVTPLSAAFAKDHGDRHDDRGNAMTMQRHDNDRHDDYRGGDDRHDNGRHRGWYKGGRIERNDWNRGERINDYGYYRLSRPRRQLGAGRPSRWADRLGHSGQSLNPGIRASGAPYRAPLALMPRPGRSFPDRSAPDKDDCHRAEWRQSHCSYRARWRLPFGVACPA
jgi:Ni/Co efflux regulator RcnB